MESTKHLIFLVVLLKVIAAQDEAELRSLATQLTSSLCKQKPAEQPHQCCIIPDLFDIETYAGCTTTDDKVVQGPSVNRGSPECAEQTCFLRNNDLLFDNDEIDKDSVKQHLDEWATKRREYMPAVNAVKDICLDKKDPLFGPKEMCDAGKLLFCITSNLYYKCPNWLETEGCTALRAYLEGCVPFYDQRWGKLIKKTLRNREVAK